MELPVDFADESHSTIEARERLIESGTRRSRRRVVDADAAAVILETWLAGQDAGV
jgi:RNase H-fold protein (predicted Holliday junction resolvase)